MGAAAVTALVLACALTPVDAQTYIATSLGTLGGSSSTGYGINDSGTVVGMSNTSLGYAHAFSYSNGTMTDLGTAAGNYSTAYGINNAGTIVGATTVPIDTSWSQAFSFSGGAFTVYGTLDPGGNWTSQAQAINNLGEIVGESNPPTGEGDELAAFFAVDSVTALPVFAGVDSYAFAVNDSGTVVGTSMIELGSGTTHAFSYSGGVTSDLGTLGGTNSRANGINNSGMIVGQSDVSGGQHAFSYSNGVLTDLGTLNGLNPSNPGLNYSGANAVNSSGTIVGWSLNPSGTQVAMVYSNGQMIDLNTVTTVSVGTIPGDLYDATAINDGGSIVANTNTGYAFLLTPEGPATHFSVVAPSTATATLPISVTVKALDANNNPAPSYSGTVRFSSSDVDAALPAHSTLTNGTGTFAVTLNTPGSETVTATDAGSASITGTSASIAVAPAPTPPPNGQLYVIDSSSNILEFNPDGSLANGNLVSASRINVPGQGAYETDYINLVVDGQNMYVLWSELGVVSEYTTLGLTENGTFIYGLGNYQTWGIAISGNELYITNEAGTVGVYDATTGATINSALISGLADPTGIAVSGGNLYVAIYNTGTIGKYNASTGAAVAVPFVSGLSAPYGIALSGNDLYVVDSGHSAVGVYDATSGAPISQYLVQYLNHPYSVAITGGNLFVSDVAGVHEFNASTGATITGTVSYTYGGDYGMAVGFGLVPTPTPTPRPRPTQ